MTDMTIANTIRDQIKMMDRMAFGAWGVRSFVGGETYLQFKSTGMVKNKGVVKIELNGMDLYDITFGKIRVGKYTEKARMDNVFAEDMVKVIDGMVG